MELQEIMGTASLIAATARYLGLVIHIDGSAVASLIRSENIKSKLKI